MGHPLKPVEKKDEEPIEEPSDSTDTPSDTIPNP